MRRRLPPVLLALSLMPAIAPAESSPALSLANAEREAHGLPPLRTDTRLRRAAEAQAAYMAQIDVMTHRDADGSDVMGRVSATGYLGCFAAENVAFGQQDAATVTAAWMGSAEHRRNILSPYARAGAVAQAESASGRIYWAMVLAAQC